VSTVAQERTHRGADFRPFVSSSGIGDFGEDGIKRYVSDHKCQAICAALRLPPAVHRAMSPTRSDADEEEEEGQQQS
jgi:hypothetical protein